MPIDYKRYPANWKTEIRPRILERDGHRCYFCKVENHASGWRDSDSVFHKIPPEGITLIGGRVEGKYKPIQIVLTIAHLHDSDPMNVDDDNLAALCQRCHNRLDAPMRRRRAAETRRRKANEHQLKLL